MTAKDGAGHVLPTGTVTFLFSDIEGSTRMLHEHGDGYVEVLAEHRRILRSAFAAHKGVELGTEGDSFFVAFARASDAVAAAAGAQLGLDGGPVRVRMGLHTGEPLLTAEGYVGTVVHRAARIAAAAHGGQVLVSQAVADLVADRLPVNAALRDLGRVRLKDLGAPEHVYQITHPRLRESFPALRSLEATPNNLPLQTTSFVGRESEIAAIKTLLGGARLLTLTGSGGSGKTRLSLHVAADVLEQFRDGAWLVELAALAGPGLVPQTVATMLGVKEEPGKLALDTLSAHLKARKLLLLLDNCEHLLDDCAKVADALLRQCPEVTIVATSREALGIAGEQTYRVPSLSLPDRSHAPTLQSLSTYESVQLFIDRALLVRHEFEVTNRNAPALASLCRHLDGIPLAIELAAAQVRSLSVEEIEGRLDQRFRLLMWGSRTALPRHQTLRALIDWSYELLRDSERLLLQRLSVFTGGWTLEAAEAVCAGEGVDRGQILDVLTSLTDKSLVMVDQGGVRSRYRLLETVREYARASLLASDGTEAIRTQHRNYFVVLAEQAEPKLKGPQQTEWLQHLEDEHDNLRLALASTLAEPGSEEGLRLCGALGRLWWTRGHLSEGREWCARALGKPGAGAPTAARAAALSTAGVLAYLQTDYAGARVLFEENLAINRQLGNQNGIARSLSNLGIVANKLGDQSEAHAMHEEALAIERELGDREGIAVSLINLGNVAFVQGDHPVAETLWKESLAISRELVDRARVAISLMNLGTVAFERGDYASARAQYAESLAIMRELGDRGLIAASLGSLGRVAFEEGDRASARVLYDESLAVQRQLGDKLGIAASLEMLAELVAALGRSSSAGRIWGAAERLREKIGCAQLPSDRHRYDRRVTAARAALGDDAAFDRAWQEGRALSLEEAIDVALDNAAERP